LLAKSPGDRLSFEEIVDRLKEIKFKVIPGVNSSKILNVVKRSKTEKWAIHPFSNKHNSNLIVLDFQQSDHSQMKSD
jgi:hypothetical protein